MKKIIGGKTYDTKTTAICAGYDKVQLMPKTTRLATAYLRVSTDAQAAADRYGLAAQRRDIDQYAALSNLRIIAYREERESGANATRPIWNDILTGGNGGYSAVVVAKADRISRDLEYFYYSKFVLKNRGIELLSANSAEDFTSLGALAPIMEAMVVAFSQFERTRINDRMTAGRLLKAAAGGYSGGQPPYGYRPNGRHGLERSDEYDALRLMRAMKDAGRTLQAICDALTAHGYKPRRGIAWRPSTVAGILNNKFYDDIYTYGGISAPRMNPG